MSGSTVRLMGISGYNGSAALQTNYVTLGSGSIIVRNQFSTHSEANAQVTWHTGGTLTYLYAYVTGSTNYVAATINTRIAGSNGNLSITGMTSSGGSYEDTTHSDTVTAGNTVSLQFYNGEQAFDSLSATGYYLSLSGANWAATNDTINRLICGGPQTLSTALQTSYAQLGGVLPTTTTQANGEWKVKLPPGVDHITLQNLYVRVSANTSTNAITVTLNGASGTGTAPSVSIANGSGAVNAEDTSHSIQAKDGDNLSFKIVTGASTVNCTVEIISIEAECSSSVFHWVSGDTVGSYENFCAGIMRLPVASTSTSLSLLTGNFSSATAGSSIGLTANSVAVGTPGNVSISGAATGWVTDSTNSYSPAATAYIAATLPNYPTNYLCAITVSTTATDGSGTCTANVSSVAAGSTGNTVIFTYTAASAGVIGGSVTIVVPSGWTAPSLTTNNVGYTTASTGSVTVASQTITVSSVTVAGGSTFTITYGNTGSGGSGATATSTAGAQTWQIQEASSSGGTLTNIGSSPSITVSYAADGSGTLTTPATLESGNTIGNIITFTYTAATGGTNAGAVTIVVPSGWSAPSTTSSAPGYITASTGTVGVAAQTITISNLTLAAAATVTITYGDKSAGGPGATSSPTAGAQTWQVQEKSTSGGTLTNIGSSPSIGIITNSMNNYAFVKVPDGLSTGEKIR